MKTKIAFRPVILCVALGWLSSSSGQSTNDSKVIKIQAKTSEDSAKLVKFKSLISPFEKEKEETANNAQQSADDNKKAAERLTNDPQDKRLARKANNAATDAKRDAKKARVAVDKLDELNKDIRKLTKQLAKEQDKLQNIRQAAQPPAAQPSP